MAEPEDPKPQAPPPLDDFDDDLVGFASPRALHGMRPDRAPQEPEIADRPLLADPVAMTAAADSPAPEPVPEPIRATAEAEPIEEVDEVGREPDTIFEPEPEPSPGPPVAPPSVAAPDPEPEADIVAESEPTPSEPAPSPHVAAPEPDPGISAASPQPEPAPDPVSREEAYGRPGATRRFERPTSRGEPGLASEGGARLAIVIYALLIAAAFSAGATALVALVLAWTARFWVKGWTRSHLLYQLRTSLIGVIGSIVGVLTLPLGLGVFLLSLTVIWVVARAATGLGRLMRREEVRNPQTWSMA